MSRKIDDLIQDNTSVARKAGELVKNREVHFLYDNYTVAAAAKKLKEWGQRAAGVFDHSERLCGILSQSDISDKIVAEDKGSSNYQVRSIMTEKLIKVSTGTTIIECHDLMIKHGIYHLVVCQTNASGSEDYCGLISRRDIDKSLKEEYQYWGDELLRYHNGV